MSTTDLPPAGHRRAGPPGHRDRGVAVGKTVWLFTIGALVGLYCAILQAMRITIGSIVIPLGLVVALACLLPIARAGAWWVGARWGALTIGIGWLAATLAMATRTPWGDLVIDSGGRQVAYLVTGTALLSLAATFPLMPARDTGRKRDGNAQGARASDVTEPGGDPPVPLQPTARPDAGASEDG